MKQTGSKYRDIIKVNSRYRNSLNPLKVLLESNSLFKSAEAVENKKKIEEIIQQELTEGFEIGGHADFNYLLGQIKNQDDFLKEQNQISDVKLCSFFIDLRNFTKRAMFIDDPGYESLKEISNIKQKAISTWIKLARYYQGHIHSITGDGLMVLFGGKGPEDQDEWTVGARSFLLALRVLESNNIFNEELKEVFKQKGLAEFIKDNNLLDIKVGIEYSPNTLMNPQGVVVNKSGVIAAVGEVKATSFEVDFSAKLLGFHGNARKHVEGSPIYGRILMLGEKYKELLNFNDEVEVKYLDKYTKQMFGTELSRSVYFLDCSDYKDKIISIEDVAGICNIYDSSVAANTIVKEIARKDIKIQHG